VWTYPVIGECPFFYGGANNPHNLLKRYNHKLGCFLLTTYEDIKMKVSELAEKIGLTPLNAIHEKDIDGVFISDMVSDIVSGAKAGNLLMTIQMHKNLIATANLVDVSAIIFVRGKKPLDDVIALADKAGITLFSAELDSWKLAIKLHELGIE
jgi:hypothetical protein